jgi:hypothetical protein
VHAGDVVDSLGLVPAQGVLRRRAPPPATPQDGRRRQVVPEPLQRLDQEGQRPIGGVGVVDGDIPRLEQAEARARAGELLETDEADVGRGGGLGGRHGKVQVAPGVALNLGGESTPVSPRAFGGPPS